MEAPVVAPAMRDGTSPFKRIASDFLANPVAVAGLALLGLVVAAAIFAPLISPQNPYDLAQIDILDSKLPPGSPSSTGGTFWLGTDDQGRDMLSAIFYGLRISLAVGVISTVLALVIGLAAGLAAAYVGGRVEQLIMRIVDIQLSFPSILIALILIAVLGQGTGKVITALVTSVLTGIGAVFAQRQKLREMKKGLDLKIAEVQAQIDVQQEAQDRQKLVAVRHEYLTPLLRAATALKDRLAAIEQKVTRSPGLTLVDNRQATAHRQRINGRKAQIMAGIDEGARR